MQLNKAFNRILILVIAISIYSCLLISYLLDLIDSFVFVSGLMFCSVLAISMILIFRKQRELVKKLLIPMFVFLFLTLFELPLTQYEGHNYNAIGYREPELILPGSGINIMAVSIKYIYFLENEEEIRQSYSDEEIYNFIKIRNRDYYLSKANWLLGVLGLGKSEFDRMRENVLHYAGEDIGVINEFLQREDMDGDSAGLALGLIAKIEGGELKNNLEIAVTGGLEKDGSIYSVGSIEEKLLIAEKNSLAYFILPQENLAEGREAKRKHSLSLKLYPVKHIREALQTINHLNEKSR